MISVNEGEFEAGIPIARLSKEFLLLSSTLGAVNKIDNPYVDYYKIRYKNNIFEQFDYFNKIGFNI